jgi:hypothetical protein
MDRMSRPYINGRTWDDFFIMKFITFCLDQALHLWNVRPILEGRTNCATWSYSKNVDLTPKIP